MTWSGPAFDPRELQSDDGESMDAAELAALNAVARQVAGAGRAVATGMPTGFSDRVMAAVATEPLPSPVAAVRIAFVKRRVGLLVAAVRGSTRMIAGPNWPGVVRVQAFGVVLVGVAALVGSASTIAVVGASALLGRFEQSPSPVRRRASVAVSPGADGFGDCRAEPAMPGDELGAGAIAERGRPTESASRRARRKRSSASGSVPSHNSRSQRGGPRRPRPTASPTDTARRTRPSTPGPTEHAQSRPRP